MPRRTVVSRPFLPRIVELERIERGNVRRGRDRRQRLRLEGLEVAGQVGEVHSRILRPMRFGVRARRSED